MIKNLAFAALILGGIYLYLSSRPITHPPGQTAPGVPLQENLSNAKTFSYKDYTIQPLARYTVTARVLGTSRYRLGRETELCPIDLALGWGPMSDSAVLDQIQISQSNRFYYWRCRHLPIPRQHIINSSANTHCIPANKDIFSKLKRLKKGSVVTIKGYLVNITAPDGWHWRSSMSREDSGKGACELIWITSLLDA